MDIHNLRHIRAADMPVVEGIASGLDQCDILGLPLEVGKIACQAQYQIGHRLKFGNAVLKGFPQLFEIISLAKEVGMHVTCLTNGTLLDECKNRELIESGLDMLKISLWACSQEDYMANYPGSNPENFNKVIEGMKLLSKLKAERKHTHPKVTLHHPINRNNFNKISNMVGLAQETRADILSFSPFKTRRNELASLALTPEEEGQLCMDLTRLKARLHSLSVNHNIDETLLRYRIGEAVQEKMPCYIAWLHARIKVDGVVLSCNPCNLQLGNLKEKPFKDIWNGEAFKNFRKRTLTRDGLIAMEPFCDCGFCCHLKDNVRVHRFFRWLSPFMANRVRR